MNLYRYPVAMLCVLLLAGLARAELWNNPDPNTLWIEDGAAIRQGEKSSEKHWRTGLTIEEASGLGFRFTGGDRGAHSTGRYVKVDPAYPWFVAEIVEVIPGRGYQALSMRTQEMTNGSLLGMVSYIQPGIFAVRTDYAHPTPKGTFLTVDLFNSAVTFKHFKMVRVPENYIEVTGPTMDSKRAVDLNDEVTFVAHLAEPAEDVTLRFFDNYTMASLKINGSQQLQLKPVGGDQKTWMATIKIESCTGFRRKGNEFIPGSFMVKAVVLGSPLQTPIWGANPVEFRLISGQ